ncbi:MAG: MinD/ParA family protein [Nitrospirae bacterium]|nr:MAG: MinD/ParA family protein [Nitrospirota bacterium]
MAMVISIASGKGGVGKSVVASNLGLLWAKQGKRVVLVDLDIGGANLHLLFGEMQPSLTLADFLARRVDSLEQLMCEVHWGHRLQLIAGSSHPLALAELSYPKKQRLLRHLRKLDADIVILDCAPGTHFHALDFFLLGSVQLAMATPDPPATIELYRFIKSAAFRKLMIRCEDRGVIKSILRQHDYEGLSEVYARMACRHPLGREAAEMALQGFHPLVIINRMHPRSTLSIAYLQQMINKFIGCDVAVAGEIPEDPAVSRSIHLFQPVVELDPYCPAAQALAHLGQSLDQYREVPCLLPA